MKRICIFSILLLVFQSCHNDNTNKSGYDSQAVENNSVPVDISYNIIASFPHDTASYTQGLIWQDNTLYEGTGLETHSKLMKVDLKSGKALQEIKLPDEIFGEGITIFNGKIYQLSWQNNKVFIYDLKTFAKLKEFSWPHEGWGLTNNGTELIVSTGESTIYFVDPETFVVKRTIAVKDNNGPVGQLNELEFVKGFIFSNIYETDYIIKIDPANGNIIGKMDMSGLLEKSGKQVAPNQGFVLNGIAYDSSKNSFYITGKKWPLMFEMKLN